MVSHIGFWSGLFEITVMNTYANSRRIYVGSLDPNLTESMLESVFRPFGKIDSSVLILDPATGKSKCYGFICFSDTMSAKNAAEVMNGFILAGRPISVGLVATKDELVSEKLKCSHKNAFKCLYVGHLPGNVSVDTVKFIFGIYDRCPGSTCPPPRRGTRSRLSSIREQRMARGRPGGCTNKWSITGELL